MNVRISEHQGVLPRTRKSVKETLSTMVRGHMHICYRQVVWGNFKILGIKCNMFILEIKECAFIKRDKPTFDKNQFSQDVLLFFFE